MTTQSEYLNQLRRDMEEEQRARARPGRIFDTMMTTSEPHGTVSHSPHRQRSVGVFYVLRDGQPVEEPSPDRWQTWMAHASDRVVARTELELADGTHLVVSTVFTGVNMARGGATHLWETVVFGLDGTPQRMTWDSLDAARDGHETICHQATTDRGIRLRE